MARTIGRFEITGTLGEGGMGIVYAARDTRLDRSVALKMIRRGTSDPEAAERLRREARAAATVSHPNVCQLYDIGEVDGDTFIAMELLEGESLAARLGRGPLPPAEAVQAMLSTLSALEALHTCGLIHRDLKPSNIFWTTHGVKILDFGLARSIEVETGETRLTMAGTVVGTPQYMSPEQLTGQPVDTRADIFAAGVVLYELLTGRPAFHGASLPEVVHAIVYEQPPALGGGTAIAAIDRVIHKAVAKRAHDRYPSAAAMAADLRRAGAQVDTVSVSRQVRPMTRLIVLPFRMLRPDPEIDFLAFSLADALTMSLSGLDSLVVRSSLTSSVMAGEQVDLRTIASAAEVDAVLTGTLLRAGDQLRVTTQLAETPSGTVLWSQTTQVQIGDVFAVQDSLTSRIVESLAVPLSARDERTLRHDVPASAKAYEFYLRANQRAYESKNWQVACDLYRQCLAEDPRYAPAWARLGRLYRVMAMYSGEGADDGYVRSDEAFRRALELNPDLSIAHNLYTATEIESGRARDAMLRLLERARSSADAELFAGLVQACRFVGLERPAIVAYEHARRLDPKIRTAVSHAYLMSGQYAQVIETDVEDPRMMSALALELMGRRDDAAALLRHILDGELPVFHRLVLGGTLAVIERDRPAATRAAEDLFASWGPRDPCAIYYFARTLAAMEHPRALELFRRAVHGGFYAWSFYRRDPWLDPLRPDPAFAALVDEAESRGREASQAFVDAGGERVLGPAYG